MTTLPWDGVDWFGSPDDLVWEPLDRTGADDEDEFLDDDRPWRLLLLDVENVCPGSRRPVRSVSRLRAVLEAAGEVDEVVAASAAGQYDRLDAPLARAGVHRHLRCGNRPDAADHALLKAARGFARRHPGCEIVVASNDHAFAAVAGVPGVDRVVLVTREGLHTSRSLLRSVDERRVCA